MCFPSSALEILFSRLKQDEACTASENTLDVQCEDRFLEMLKYQI